MSSAQRKPRLLFRLEGSLSLRYAARTFCASLFHEPPRITRWADASTDVLQRLNLIPPVSSSPVRGPRAKPSPGFGMGRDCQSRVVRALQLPRVEYSKPQLRAMLAEAVRNTG